MRPRAGVGLRPPLAAADSGWTESTLREGWSSVGRTCLIRAYPIKGVISDTLASLLKAVTVPPGCSRRHLEANMSSDIVDNSRTSGRRRTERAGDLRELATRRTSCPRPASSPGSTRWRMWPRSSTSGSPRSTRWSAVVSFPPSSWAGVASGAWTASSSRRTSSGCTSRRPTGRASTRSSALLRKRDGDDRGEPDEPACPHRAPAPCFAQVVLGDLEVVAANGFDGAVAAGPVGEQHPDGLPPPGELPKRQPELVAARRRSGGRP